MAAISTEMLTPKSGTRVRSDREIDETLTVEIRHIATYLEALAVLIVLVLGGNELGIVLGNHLWPVTR